MAIAVIEWLNSGKDYEDGVKLYERIGSNHYLKKLFASGQTSISAEKLENELLKLTDKVDVKTANSKPKSKPAEEKPKYINDINNKWKSLYKAANDERYYFKERLKNGELSPSRESREKALSILDKMESVRILWKNADEFEKTGIIPKENDQFNLSQMSIREIFTREKNLLTYITKCSKMIESTDDPEIIAKKTSQLERHKLELNAIAKHITKIDKENAV